MSPKDNFFSPKSIVRYQHSNGSDDAFALAKLATEQLRPIVVFTASALAAQRLLEEIPFFAPNLKIHLYLIGKHYPTTHFHPIMI